MRNVDWAGLAIAIVAGVAVGVSIPLLLYWMGLSGKFMGPLIGGITAPAVTIVYQLRQRRRAQRADTSG